MRKFVSGMLLLFSCWVSVAGTTNADAYWEIFGDFGKAAGEVKSDAEGVRLEADGYTVRTVVSEEDGVSLRRTVLKNVSDRTITVRCLLDRFPLEEGDWEVYTQASHWENESRGRWLPLHAEVTVRNPNMRSCNGVTPMLALWNRQTGRGRVFHLLTDSAYEIRAVRYNPRANWTAVRVEAGMDARALAYRLAPGETVALPEVLTYEFRNRLDLDCHRLHAWWNKRYPGHAPRAIYNTWLCRFDKLDADFLLKQVAKAKELGMEYFVIDAGWFGPKANWWSVRGEWEERQDGYLNGRMAEVSEAVRAAGMRFGFWVEAESVAPTARVRREHPEWLLPGHPDFLDFTNPQAFDYIVGTVCALVKKYRASFLKFDYNQDLGYDETGRDFTAYNAGYRAFVREVRRRNPGIYLEGCASGGTMMDLGWAREFDGLWLSDNQSPRHGVRIMKETMLRMPPRLIERWIVARTLTGIQPNSRGQDERLVATDGGDWTHIRSYAPSYIESFTAGGQLCFSCDLTAFSDGHLKTFAEVVAKRKADGAFWQMAVGRILCDSPNMTVFQYSDEGLDDVRLFVAAEATTQNSVKVYPVLDSSATYLVDGKRRKASEIVGTGIEIPVWDFAGGFVLLRKVE